MLCLSRKGLQEAQKLLRTHKFLQPSQHAMGRACRTPLCSLDNTLHADVSWDQTVSNPLSDGRSRCQEPKLLVLRLLQHFEIERTCAFPAIVHPAVKHEKVCYPYTQLNQSQEVALGVGHAFHQIFETLIHYGEIPSNFWDIHPLWRHHFVCSQESVSIPLLSRSQSYCSSQVRSLLPKLFAMLILVAGKGRTQSLGPTELHADVGVATSLHVHVNKPVAEPVVRVHMCTS